MKIAIGVCQALGIVLNHSVLSWVWIVPPNWTHLCSWGSRIPTKMRQRLSWQFLFCFLQVCSVRFNPSPLVTCKHKGFQQYVPWLGEAVCYKSTSSAKYIQLRRLVEAVFMLEVQTFIRISRKHCHPTSTSACRAWFVFSRLSIFFLQICYTHPETN